MCLNHLGELSLDILTVRICSLISLTNFSDVLFLLQDKSLDCSELAGIKKATEAAHKCLGSGRTAAQGDIRDAVEELERKVLEMNEHQQKVQQPMAHNGKNTQIHLCLYMSERQMLDTDG